MTSEQLLAEIENNMTHQFKQISYDRKKREFVLNWTEPWCEREIRRAPTLRDLIVNETWDQR